MSSFFRLKQLYRQVKEISVRNNPMLSKIHAEQREVHSQLKSRLNEYVADSLVKNGCEDYSFQETTDRWTLELVLQGARAELEPLAIFAKPYSANAYSDFYGKARLDDIAMDNGFWVKDEFFSTAFCFVLNVSTSTKNAAHPDELFSHRVDTYSNRLAMEGYRLSTSCKVSDYWLALQDQDNVSMAPVVIPGLETNQGIKIGIQKSNQLLDIYLDLPCGLYENYNQFTVKEGYWRVHITQNYPLARVIEKGYSMQDIEKAVTALVDYAFNGKTHQVNESSEVPTFSVESLCD